VFGIILIQTVDTRGSTHSNRK